jgi:hypothetical protein
MLSTSTLKQNNFLKYNQIATESFIVFQQLPQSITTKIGRINPSSEFFSRSRIATPVTWLQLESGSGRRGLSTKEGFGHSVTIRVSDVLVLEVGPSTISLNHRWRCREIRGGCKRQQLALEARSGPSELVAHQFSRWGRALSVPIGGGGVGGGGLRGAARWRRDLEATNDSEMRDPVV